MGIGASSPACAAVSIRRAAAGVGGGALEHRQLVLRARDDERARLARSGRRRGAELEPALARAQRALEILAVADAGDERVAEVADARADRAPVALEQRDAQAAPARLVRVGEADDAGADDAEVGVDRLAVAVPSGAIL